MNSAAKLRSRRGIAVLGTTALIATSFGPAALANWDAPIQGGTVADGNLTDGTIGIVDTDRPVNQDQGHGVHTGVNTDGSPYQVADNTANHGATLLQAGQNGQDLADVRLTIPNRFQAGDKIQVRLFDRSATENNDGNTNSGPSTRLTFNGTPTVQVSQPMAADTQVAADTESTDPVNTETTPDSVWAATGNAAPNNVRPGVAPAFRVSPVASGAAGYNDIIELEITSDASTGDPNGTWVLTLSDLKVDVGSAVTPGEVRLVPFATNTGATETQSPWFRGNTELDTQGTPATGDDVPRDINIYTVPAYVAPARVAMENLQISADGTAQNVGALTIGETQAYSLGDGQYTISFDGAQIANTDLANIQAAVAGGGANESVQVTGFVTDANGNRTGLTYTVSNASDATASTITFSGLTLRSEAPGEISVNVTGSRVDAWFANAGYAPLIDLADRPDLANSEAFVNEGGDEGATTTVFTVPQDAANTANADLAPSAAAVIGAGPQTVTYTAGTPAPATITDSATDPTNVDSITETGDPLGVGPNTITARTAVTTNTLVAGASNTAGVADLTQAELNLFPTSVATSPETFTLQPDLTKDRLIIADGTGAAVFETANGTGTTVTPGTAMTFFLSSAPANSISLTADQTGAFQIATAETTQAGLDLVDANGVTWYFNGAPVADTPVAFNNAAGGTVTLTPDAGTAIEPGTFVTASASTGATWAITVQGQTYTSTDGVVFNRPAGAPAELPLTISFGSPLATTATSTFTIVATEVPLVRGVNQTDIVAPIDDMTVLGSAVSEMSRIGGNNRYETAAKVAERAYVNGSENVIIASGENFPDALSASYLSQRMGAPILLTMNGRIPQDTLEALRDLKAQKVFIIGGDQAVSAEVETALRDLNTYTARSTDDRPVLTGSKMQTQRIGGGSRYTTNQLVNMYGAAWGGAHTIGKTVYRQGEASKYTAIFARGDNFPDALAAGVLTAGQYSTYNPEGSETIDQYNQRRIANALPLILTTPDTLSESAVAQIDNLDVEHGLVIGSEAALSAGVKTSIENKGVSTNRLGGEDRYFTAAAIAEFAMRPLVGTANDEYPGLGFIGEPDGSGNYNDDVTSFLATGIKYPDALTAGPWVGRSGNVLNLTQGANELSAGTTDFLTKRAADVDRAVAIGLGQAVSTQVLNQANRLASAR